MAVLISLFAAGVKMPVPFRWLRWRTPILLASVSMALTVALVAVFARYVLDLPWGLGVLLGAIVSPTDPVLATDVQIRHPGDNDRLRFNLTCEAGMNDGSAFPFVMLGMGLLGMHELGDGVAHWLLVDVLWATTAGIGVGVLSGVSLARLCLGLRRRSVTSGLLNDLLGLGLIGTVYGISELISAWGFLAVFFAGVALRQTELKLAGEPASESVRPATDSQTATPGATEVATVSEGSLMFKEHLERLSEILLVLLVGGTLFLDSWSWRGVGFACFLFVVARPVSVLTGLSGSATPLRIRAMAAWFGVRGIGSLYYLMYAIDHGLPEPMAVELIHLTLIVVTLSILVHGISVKPLMERYRRRRS
jgi:NhaP-type Na+/H+ or K+/H+ antiporter